MYNENRMGDVVMDTLEAECLKLDEIKIQRTM